MNESLFSPIKISDAEFKLFKELIFSLAGITLPDTKKDLVVSRLTKRIKKLNIARFQDYYIYINSKNQQEERQNLIDLLTTNETFFFRESDHFQFLNTLAQERKRGLFRAWSAASSSGEEAYSMAMTLADARAEAPWEVIGTDISRRVLAKAKNGHYSMERTEGIPLNYLKSYCLKGTGSEAGTLLIDRKIRQNVQFLYSNLLQPRNDLGQFDVIFLRNVMIYFDNPTKEKVINQLIPFLKKDGFLLIGHAETISQLKTPFVMHKPTIYRLPEKKS